MADSDSRSDDKRRQEPPPIEFLKPGETQAPPEPQQPAAWVTRPEDYQRPQYAQPPAPPRATAAGPGNMARLAGGLLILAAVVSAGGLLYNSLSPMSPADYANFTSDSGLYALNQVCSLIVIWAQATMIIGGIMALQRMNWRMTAGLAFFSMLMIAGFALLVIPAVLDVSLIASALLSLVGFVLTIRSRREFLS
jgi:hypothetical protein